MPSESKKIITMSDEQLISKVGKNNVEIIKEWLSKQPHLPEVSGMYYTYALCTLLLVL